jgi:molybdate transport system substrate-binding protein
LSRLCGEGEEMTCLRTKTLIPFVAALASISTPLFAHGAEAQKGVLVSAAASLKDVMLAIATDFEKAHPITKLMFNFAASGQLKMQIENGAPVDAYVSAAAVDLDDLERKNLLVTGSRQVIANNSLVLIGSKIKHSDLLKSEDLLKKTVSRVAIGNPATVPAGCYAKETLESRGLYEKLRDKLVMAENVRQVLDYVARGEVDAGYVYKTDTLIERKVEIIEKIPPHQHKPITYSVAVLKTGRSQDEARTFVEFLRSQEAAKTFKKFGFE